MLTLPNTTDGCQQTASIMGDDILSEPLPIASGLQFGAWWRGRLVPSYAVDETKLQCFHERYRSDGQFLPYGA